VSELDQGYAEPAGEDDEAPENVGPVVHYVTDSDSCSAADGQG
jgi:hypothetical protein